eukprot:PhM_4_TR9524/c0_g1_i1/m.33451
MSLRHFWEARVQKTSLATITSAFNEDRNLDKKLRWSVRKDIQASGVTSNLFRILLKPNFGVWRYDLQVRTSLTAPKMIPKESAAPIQALVAPRRGRSRVPLSRVWKAYANYLKTYPALPPMVRVFSRVYTTQPLPPDLLTLPKTYYDVSWNKCELRLVQQNVPLASLPLSELQMVLNRVIPWSLRKHSREDGNYTLVRERDGKIVCTNDGIAVENLRIFRGITAAVLHVQTDERGVSDLPEGEAPTVEAPDTAVLGTLQANGSVPKSITVVCDGVVRTTEVRKIPVVSFLVRDRSGRMQLTVWGGKTDLLTAGATYTLSGGSLKVKAVDPRYQKGDFTVELSASANLKAQVVKEAPTVNTDDGNTASDDRDPCQRDVEKLGLHLGLRLDSRCTVARETSLLHEIYDEFGKPPYSDETQTQISDRYTAMAVVNALDLFHSHIHSIRFDYERVEDIPMEASLRDRASEFEVGQPYAVLKDYSIMPLQVLHCCYDPTIQLQDITIPACSLMPTRRLPMLQRFVAALQDGMAEWGLTVKRTPMVTKSLDVISPPRKIKAPVTPDCAPRFTCFLAVGNANPKNDRENKRVTDTRNAFAKKLSVRSSINIDAKDAMEAVEKLRVPAGASGAGACFIITCDKESKETLLLMAQCLRLGMIPVVRRPVSEKKVPVVASGLKRMVADRIGANPLRTIDIDADVPNLKGRITVVVGIDVCHTPKLSTGALVAIVIGASALTPITHCTYWHNTSQGSETENVSRAFDQVLRGILKTAKNVDNVIVLQDGSIYSEMSTLQSCVPKTANFSFICLHKRTHVRFTHPGREHTNCTKGSLISSLTPAPAHLLRTAPRSFFLQIHDCFMSTARTVQYVCHHVEGVEIEDLQRLCFVLGHAYSMLSTKLPFPTRCAHRLAAFGNAMYSVAPEMSVTDIPASLRHRMWYF